MSESKPRICQQCLQPESDLAHKPEYSLTNSHQFIPHPAPKSAVSANNLGELRGYLEPDDEPESKVMGAREFLIHGGAGHEDGEDGLRAGCWYQAGLISAMEAYAAQATADLQAKLDACETQLQIHQCTSDYDAGFQNGCLASKAKLEKAEQDIHELLDDSHAEVGRRLAAEAEREKLAQRVKELEAAFQKVFNMVRTGCLTDDSIGDNEDCGKCLYCYAKMALLGASSEGETR